MLPKKKRQNIEISIKTSKFPYNPEKTNLRINELRDIFQIWLNAPLIQYQCHGGFLSNPSHFCNACNLIFQVSQSQGCMYNDKYNRQHDSHQEHQDAATLVDEKVPKRKGGKHDHGGVLLLHRVQEGNDFKDNNGREEVVGLIIEEVADESVEKLVHVVNIRDLKSAL